jgi:uncharacterized protein (UPF0332 family)
MDELNKKYKNHSEILNYLNKAKEKLKSAEILYREEQYEDSATRIYYCMFHSIIALLKQKNVDLSKHSHNYILQQFRKEYINSKVFPQLIFSKIMTIKNYREIADYTINEEISKDDVKSILEDCEEIYSLLKSHVLTKIKENKEI